MCLEDTKISAIPTALKYFSRKLQTYTHPVHEKGLNDQLKDEIPVQISAGYFRWEILS